MTDRATQANVPSWKTEVTDPRTAALLARRIVTKPAQDAPRDVADSPDAPLSIPDAPRSIPDAYGVRLFTWASARRIAWVIALLAAGAAAVFGVIDQHNATSAPQQAAGAAIDLLIAVVPYVFARAVEQLAWVPGEGDRQ
jgi:hypothetical protein